MTSKTRTAVALVVATAVLAAAVALSPGGFRLGVTIAAGIVFVAALVAGFMLWRLLAAVDARGGRGIWGFVIAVSIATVAASLTPDGIMATILAAGTAGLFGGLASSSNRPNGSSRRSNRHSL